MHKRKLSALISTLLIIAAPFVVLSQRNNIYDWYMLRGYTAPETVVQLAADTTMAPAMRRLFYVNRPGIEDKALFNKHCRSDELTIVLGCFIDRRGIYLLDVTDGRLNGVEQVTAAHETLHAVYARLSTAERKNVDFMTNAAFMSLSDQRVKDNIELYRKQNPAVVPNELHSILGTEVRNLPPELETYYKKYFLDRSKIVGYSEQYEQAFTDLKNQVQAYDDQLASLSQQIKSLQATLTTESADLQAQRSRMDNLKSSNKIAEYNAAVPNYNALVNAYNRDVDSLTRMVNEYNDIVPKRNAIANEENDLAKAIDSRSTVPARQ